jgi:hypothetical protein
VPSSTVQRNDLVSTFSFKTPWFDKDAKGKQTNNLAISHQKWLTQAQTAINASIQLSATIPASSTSPGQPGTLVPFAGGFYFCVGSNSWLKFIGAPF